MKWQHPKTYALLLVAGLAFVVIAFNVQVCRDWGFICENTGSKKGYRKWLLSFKTGHWYKQSPLEKFMQVHAPEDLVHRWTSYTGTGKNILGIPVLFEHGRPGFVLQLHHEIQGRWIEKNDPAKVRRLYDLFVSEDQDAIQEQVKDIWDEVMRYEDQELPNYFLQRDSEVSR